MSTQPAPAPTMCASHELTWGAREKDAPATPSLGVRTAHRRMPSGYPNIRGTHAARCRTITKRLPHKEGSLEGLASLWKPTPAAALPQGWGRAAVGSNHPRRCHHHTDKA